MWLKTIGTAVVVAGVALGSSAFAAQNAQQTGNGAYCLQKAGDTMDCKYATMAACTSAAGGVGSCLQNPKRATTGSGTTTTSTPKSK